jgi:GNAT superfamily N-acetyltransferase
MSQIAIHPLAGEALRAAIPDLARLRCAVFAEWPYLYHGDPEAESDYLRDFAASEQAVLIAARDGETIVGIATASPMDEQKDTYRQAFAQRGIDTASLFYFGESVLLPSYRGRGIGHAFFDHREEQAKLRGARAATFCGVVRPLDHPARPADYQPLDPFWRKRGYAPVEGLVSHFTWKDHGEEEASAKPMHYWLKTF